jgi:hypothetical protein
MRRSAVRRTWITTILALVTAAAGILGSAAALKSQGAAKTGTLIVYGDITVFAGPGKPENCFLKNRYKHGDPVGFRIFVADPQTSDIELSAQLVVHLNYGGKTQDVPMRYRATAAQPERKFWVAKWVVPADAPMGIVRYTVSAKDQYGRTGEFKPFDVDSSQLTIVE